MAPAPDTASAALAGARVVDLEQPRRAGQPGLAQHGPGLSFVLHRRHERGLARRTSASGQLVCSDHAGTHIDALCHQAVDCTLHGQVAVDPDIQTPTGFRRHGAEEIPPIIAPGVLIDLPAERGPLAPRETIGVDHLRSALGQTPIPGGAVVLVRTGFGAAWSDPSRYLDAPGLDRAASAWIADRGPVAVGIDNARWDEVDAVDPDTGMRAPGHALLLVQRGIYIIENLALEELAAVRPTSFTVVCLPLKLEGATGSPVRPVALVADEARG